MRTEITKLHKTLGTTFVYVTHDQTEAMTMADKIIIMKDGLVQQIGPPQEVYDHPNNMFVAGFIGSPAMNFVDVKVTDDLKLYNKKFTLDTTEKLREVIKNNDLAGKDVVLGIRPEDLEDSDFIQDAGEGNTLVSRVEVTEPMGAEIYAYIDIDGVLITARVSPKSKVTDGQDIKLYVDIDQAHLFDRKTEQAYI